MIYCTLHVSTLNKSMYHKQNIRYMKTILMPDDFIAVQCLLRQVDLYDYRIPRYWYEGTGIHINANDS